MSLPCLACREPLCPHSHCCNWECDRYREDDPCIQIDEMLDHRSQNNKIQEEEEGMTLPEAEALIEQIKRDEPTGRIVALWDGSAKAPTKYRVRVELLRHRVIWLLKPDDWESVKMAWSLWLPGLYEEKNLRCDATHYLVDGIPMTIYQMANGYWVAQHYSNGKHIKKSLGKNDPRGKYPIVEKREEKVS